MTMSNNQYHYKVTQLIKDTQGIVTGASFTLEVSDGEDTFSFPSFTAFNHRPETPIPFDQLTEEKVVSWITDSVGPLTEEQADVELQAYKLRKTQNSSGPLPW